MSAHQSPYVASSTPAPRRRAAWDIALTIVLLVLAGVLDVIGGVFALFSLAFLDYCPAGCSAQAAGNAEFAAGAIITIVLVVLLVLGIVLLVIRRRAWWVGALALVISVGGWVLGFALYIAAVTPNGA